MKSLVPVLLFFMSAHAVAQAQDPRDLKALNMAQVMYSENINPAKGAATFVVSEKTCGGEDGTETCVLKVSVSEKNPEARVTGYLATFKNQQLVSIKQACKYCW